MLSKLDLEPKGEGHIRIQNTMTLGTENMPLKTNLSRVSLSTR